MIIEQNIPLADKNWFMTGGPARYWCEPHTEQDFAEALNFARQHNLDIFVLGTGANILISDAGFDGLVIRPVLTTIEVDGAAGLVTAGAGVSIPHLIDTCLAQQMIGLEEFSGIPGTVGGSVFINIHYFQFLLGQFLHHARVIDRTTGQIHDVDAAWFEFGYDHSKLFDRQYYLVNATFKVTPVDTIKASYACGRRDEIIRHRRQRYPNSNTCGSFFRNFLPEELPFEINGKKMPFVAYYLDKIGVKGALRVGNAVVSYQHANMLVTQQGATTNDVIELARTMQRMVHEQFGIVPHVECQLVGFEKNPLE
ncbi:MAG: UDP-N-acetylmuramate dehydrogenase [Candidatus Babeliales bacterium]|jgi:UDP-N-acetylmuramate dehydrogenase